MMTDAPTLLRDLVAYFDGLADMIGEAPPSKEQWAKIRAKMAKLSEQMQKLPQAGQHNGAAPAHSIGAGATPEPAPAATSAAKPAARIDAPKEMAPEAWKRLVLRALIDSGEMDNDSAKEALADPRFVITTSMAPATMAKRIVKGVY